MPLIDILGYIATSFLVVAYALAQRKTPINRNTLHALNFFGSVGVGSNAYFHGAMPGVVINVVWVIITVHACYFHNWGNKKN